MPFFKRHLLLVGLLILVTGWSVFLFLVGPEILVAFIGEENGYLLAFVLALLSGSSSLTSFSFFAALVTLAVGGLNPIILGIVAGTGEIGGDSIFYYLGYRGWHFSKESWRRFEEWVSHVRIWILGRSRWVMPAFIFCYSGFTPLPNDIITTSLGFVHYGYTKTILPLWLGNIVRAVGIAYLVSLGFF